MELLETLSLITSAKMGGTTRLLAIYQSMEVSNLLDYLRSGEIDCRISPISWLMLRPQCGAVDPMIPIRYGEEVSMIPQARPMFLGVIPLAPILINFHCARLVHAFTDAVYAEIFIIIGVISIYGTSTIVFASRDEAETFTLVLQLNQFSSKIPLLV